MTMNSEIMMYQTEDGQTKIETTFENDSVWLSIDQMFELFQRNKFNISRHIKNRFNERKRIRNYFDDILERIRDIHLSAKYSVGKFLIST